MHIFYTPEILKKQELPEEEAQHCIRVLRLKEGSEITLTDGKGSFYKAAITNANHKHCQIEIIETISQVLPWTNRIHIAMAPTKNMDRTEWFAEKTTEIGINKISFLSCRFSERKEIKTHRIEKILISAMKQSLKATLPEVEGMIDFRTFISQCNCEQKFIAHCYQKDKNLLSKAYLPNKDAVILIGPEGDFSEEEVEFAIQAGFKPISLGESRLRTETAALAACHTIHIINQINAEK